ncbi:acetyl CoA:N6-hydroxylysine acetyl transferase [Ochrobactrum sp. 19YEA23]|uniref:GNAT family N-acetyltransferase n=1 Tax=Ochrobactrum sp. 19YEA23 TaxID=3039854 RepID=UPI002A280B56|nr:acetyl CoA:N6-hydroxylysine acetyl transferase [Ochrobactrum sp. 19YEA23]
MTMDTSPAREYSFYMGGESSMRLRLPASGFTSHASAVDSRTPTLFGHVTATANSFSLKRNDENIAAGAFSFASSPNLDFETLPPATTEVKSAVLAVLEALFTCHPDLPCVKLTLPAYYDATNLLAIGALEQSEDGFTSRPELLFQLAQLWLGEPHHSYPAVSTITKGIHHPVRPPKPHGTVYRRHIPWIDKVLSFHVANLESDLEHFHRWMNDPRVSAIWEDQGSLDYHRDFLNGRLTDPRTLPLIGTFDGIPFGYFELYWAKEDRLGPYYEADPYDRGWHVAIGEDAFRGKAFVSAWLPSLMHYMFLADSRTSRIVGEPVHHHQQQIRNLDRSGFAKIKHVQFPHKKALLVMLLRERFFADRLLSPDLGSLIDEQGQPVIGSLSRDAG